MKKGATLLFLVVLLVGFRIVAARWSGVLPGFEPLSAVFFCLAACLGLRWLWLPCLAWLLSYPLTNSLLGYLWDWQAAVVLGGFAVVAGLGWMFRGNRRALPLLAGSVAAAVVFYLLTNFASWLVLPDYPKTLGGLVQAQWTGAPHHLLPTWVFLKNAVLANLIFTGLFLLGQRQAMAGPVSTPRPVRVRQEG